MHAKTHMNTPSIRARMLFMSRRWVWLALSVLLASAGTPAAAQIAFVDGGSISVGNNPWFIASGHSNDGVNCQSYLDLAVANWGSNSISLAYGYASFYGRMECRESYWRGCLPGQSCRR